MKRQLPVLTFSTVLIMFLNCSAPSTVGNGGSSETVNALVTVEDSTIHIGIETSSAATFTMQFFAPDYRPASVLGYSSEILPAQQWSAPYQGQFNLLIRDTASVRACFIEKLSLKKDTSYSCIGKIKTTAVISGSLITIDSTTPHIPYIVAINGSPFFTTSDENGNFKFEYIPEGPTTMSVREDTHRLFVKTAQYRIPVGTFEQSGILKIIIP